MIHRLYTLDVDQLHDAYGAWFPETFVQVYEEEKRAVRYYVRRGPWVPLVRRYYRTRTYLGGWHWRLLYPLIRRHYFCMGYRLNLAAYKKAIRCELRGRPCNIPSQYKYSSRRRYGPPIWKAD